MVSFIAFIVAFFFFIPTFRRLDRQLHRNGNTLSSRLWRSMFHDGVDGELQRVKTEMKHMSETIEQNRGKLSDPDTNPAEKQQLAFTLDQTTRSYVRLVRRYEVDMTDDEFDHAMLVLKGKNDQSGAKVLWMKNSI